MRPSIVWVALGAALSAGPARAQSSPVDRAATLAVRTEAPSDVTALAEALRDAGIQLVSNPPADFVATLDNTDDGLRFTLTARSGRTVVSREFTLVYGRSPALRAVAVAIAQAVQIERAARRGPPLPEPPPPPAAPPPPAPPASPSASPSASPAPAPPVQTATAAIGMSAEVGPAALWLADTPIIGVHARARLTYGRLSLAGRGAWLGRLCCRATVDSDGGVALDATLQRWSGGVEVGWRWAELDDYSASVLVAAGGERIEASVLPRAFVGNALATTVVLDAWWSEVGAAFSGPVWGPVRWRAEAGVLWRSRALDVALPAGFPQPARPLRLGRWSPRLALVTEVVFF